MGYTTVLDCSNERPNFWSYVAMFLWIGWLAIFQCMFLTLFLLYYFNMILLLQCTLVILLPIFITSACYHVDHEKQPKWTEAFAFWVISHAKRYFSFTVKVEDRELINKLAPCVFSLEPHDVLPVGIIFCNKHCEIFPNHKTRGTLGFLNRFNFLLHLFHRFL